MRLFLLALFSFCLAVARAESPKPSIGIPSQSPSKPSKTSQAGSKKQDGNPNKADLQKLNLIAKIFRQADAVAREMWWVVAGERRSALRSPFGKLSRAVLMQANLKLSKDMNYRCDRYRIDEKASGYAKAEVYEACSVRNQNLIAEWEMVEGARIQTIFYPDSLADILGLGASVMNKKVNCTLSFSAAGILKGLDCKNWTQDRNEKQIVDLATFTYQAEGEALLEIHGAILEGLNPVKKIDSQVKLTGSIMVTETDIPDPHKRPTAKKEPPVGAVLKQEPAVAAPPPKNDSPQGTLPNPDYIPYVEPHEIGEGQKPTPTTEDPNPYTR